MFVSIPTRPAHAFPSVIPLVLVLESISILTLGCGSSRISGTYIAREADIVQILQLTETDNGKITGAFNSVGVNTQGQISTGQSSVDGAVDHGQITLKMRVFLFGQSLAGTIRGNTIQFQTLESNGTVQTTVFKRGSQSDFKKYADDLKHIADTIALSKTLGQRSQQLRQAVQNAERWISFAELHSQRIPGVKDYYRKLESTMQSLVASERETSNGVAKAQMKAEATQRNVAGQQTDMQVDQMWDRTIGDSGRNLTRIFGDLPPNCASDELRKYGATAQAINTWQTACQQARAERERFDPILNALWNNELN
jgi:hypothetical protein